ncbi:protein THYLAKOID ASSEMBLY 8, chloroplastic [Miscanthus floridulus]|uniref:protein THYLAKOID ASSEMBLY 8, chloroplastic n=1 Tax=Miscanthus floridulus TaxID=154761 RepID=UPI0034594538
MASLLLVPRPNRSPCAKPGPSAPHKPRPVSITCGPRDNRGPLQRGRSLSTEAILAIQSLKRLTSADRSPAAASAAAVTALGRLLKADLVAAMAELQRQGHWSLALAALHVARAEPWYRPDPALYATFVSSAPASPSGEDEAEAAVDALVEAFLEEKARGGGFVDGEEDVYKLTRLLRALVAKGRGRAAWRVYEAAVREGGLDVDEYVYRVMARGMKRLGLHEEAAEVEADFAEWEATVSPPARDVLDEMRSRDESKTAANAS